MKLKHYAKEKSRESNSREPQVLEDFKGGKVKARQALFGACMKELKGTANTDVIRDLLDRKLESL